MIPGVSGGSMAMVLGIYDELIASVSSFFKNIKKSLLFLGIFCAGAIIGMFLFAKQLGKLLDQYPMILMYFFMGAVAGSIPMMLRKAKVLGKNRAGDSGGLVPILKQIVFFVLGVVPVILLSFLPEDLLSFETMDFKFYVVMIIAGVVAAIALVLPGISISHMLVMLGLYDHIIGLLDNGISLQWLSMIPFGVGLLAGVFLCTKVLESAMNNHPTPTYLIILGFLIGSIFEVFPGLPTGLDLLICLPLFAVGFFIIFFLSLLEEKHETAQTSAS